MADIQSISALGQMNTLDKVSQAKETPLTLPKTEKPVLLYCHQHITRKSLKNATTAGTHLREKGNK